MKIIITGIFVILVGIGFAAEEKNTTDTHEASGALTLWYTQPATEWTQALPIGTGRLGAMVYGGIEQEHLQLNEDTLWSGGPHSYANLDAYQYLATAREQLEQGAYADAEATAQKMLGSPNYQ